MGNVSGINKLLSLLVFLAAGTLLIGDALNNNSLLYGRDTVSHDYIVFYSGWESIRQFGTLPLWTPYLFAGIPFIGSLAFCPFYPTNFLALLLHFPLAFNLQYFLALIVAGFGFYYLCRSFQLNPFSALFGGVMFMSSGHLVSLIYPGHLQKAQAIVWLPLVVGSANFYLRRKEGRYILLAATGLALQILAGHFQIFFYTLQLLLLFLLWSLLLNKRSSLVSCFLPLASCLLLALGLSAVQLLPSLEMATESNRAPRVPYQEAIAGSFPPEELAELLLPRFVGDSTQKGYRFYQGRWGERLVSDYVGAGVWIFALLCLFTPSRLYFHRYRWFFLLIFLLSALLACGKFSPLFPLFYNYVPGYDKFRSPATIMILMTFSLVCLASFGFEQFCQKINPSLYGNKAFKKTLLLSISFIFVALISHLLPPSSLFSAITYFSFNAAIILAVMTLIIRFSHKSKYLYPLLAILILVAFNDVKSNSRIFIHLLPREDYHNYLFNYWLDNIILSQEINAPPRLFEEKNVLILRMVARRIATPHGYHPLGFKRYFQLLEKYWFDSPGFLRLFNVNFIATEISAESSELATTKLAKFKEMGYRTIARDNNQFLLMASKESLPYIYVPERVFFLESSRPVLATLSADFNPYKLSLVESPALYFGGKEVLQNPAEIKLDYKIKNYTDNKIELEMKVEKACWVVFSEPNFNGWSARLNGTKELPIFTANNLFRALFLPAGAHHLKFIYRPFSFRLGLYLSLATLSIVIILLILFTRLKISKRIP